MDRISSLPDILLDQILSFLLTRYVVQTCVLSKSWKHKWCSIPTLQFDDNSPTRLIDFVLFLRNRRDLEKFSLSVRHIRNISVSRLNAWIVAVIKDNVQVLDLEVSNYRAYELTPRVFSCESMKVLNLKLDFLMLNIPDSVRLPRLKIMHLRDISFPNEQQTDHILSGCPMLETLIIEALIIKNGSLLNIFSLHMKYLKIKAPNFSGAIKICTPSLEYLDLQSKNLVWEVGSPEDLRSLIKVSVVTDSSINPSIIYNSLKNAQSIILSVPFITWSELQDCPTNLFSNLKFLELEDLLTRAAFQGINYFLQNSPYIERFILKNSQSELNLPSDPDDEEDELRFSCMLPCLKVIKIQNFLGEKQRGYVCEKFTGECSKARENAYNSKSIGVFGKKKRVDGDRRNVVYISKSLFMSKHIVHVMMS